MENSKQVIAKGKYVLVEQTMTKKSTNLTFDKISKEQQEDLVDITFKVIGIGSRVPEEYGIKVGDVPVLSKYSDFHGVKVVSETKDKKVMIMHTLIPYKDIIAVE